MLITKINRKSFNGDMEKGGKAEIEALKSLTPYLNKEVLIKVSYETDYIGGEKMMKGKIKLINDNPFFIPVKNKKCGYHLTAGLFNGFACTLQIEEIILTNKSK